MDSYSLTYPWRAWEGWYSDWTHPWLRCSLPDWSYHRLWPSFCPTPHLCSSRTNLDALAWRNGAVHYNLEYFQYSTSDCRNISEFYNPSSNPSCLTAELLIPRHYLHFNRDDLTRWDGIRTIAIDARAKEANYQIVEERISWDWPTMETWEIIRTQHLAQADQQIAM